MKEKLIFHNIDEYHHQYEKEIQERLQSIRKIITKTVPQVQEVISYQLPAFKWNKVLIYYAAYKNHIGIYPGSEAIVFFKDELSMYKTSKGAIQIPHDVALPLKLIENITKYRAKKVNEKK